jgi:hypothetical protein
MNFFEQELRRLAKACDGIVNPTFAGRACYGDLGGDNRVRLQFITQGYADCHDALKVTVLNRTDGEVDSLSFRFRDTWGKKYDHGYHDGIPHIWTNSGKSEWYAYRPTDADINRLAAEVGGYLAVFADRSLISEKARGQSGGKESVVQKIRGAAKNPAPRKTAPAKKKTDPEL